MTGLTPNASSSAQFAKSAAFVGGAAVAGIGVALVYWVLARGFAPEPDPGAANNVLESGSNAPARPPVRNRSNGTLKPVSSISGEQSGEDSEPAEAAAPTHELAAQFSVSEAAKAPTPEPAPMQAVASEAHSDGPAEDVKRSKLPQTGDSVESADDVAGRPIPDAKAQKKAEQQIRQVFRDDYSKAKTPPQKSEFAWRLLDQAAKTTDDAVSKYVLLREARDIAAKVGDAATALRAVEEMGKAFRVDLLFQKRSVLVEAAKAKLSAGVSQQLAGTVLAVIDEAVAADRFEVATQLCRVASGAASKAGDRRLVKKISDLRKGIGPLRKAYQSAQKAADVLKEKPNDPEANLTRGRYLCLRKNEWTLGLPMLLKGSDPDLKSLAEQETAAPSEPGAQVKLADQWWKQGERIRSALKDASRERAVFWYLQALPKLSGLENAAIAKKVREHSDGRPPSWAYQGFGRFVSEISSFNHPKIPDELTVEYKNRAVRITGVCRHDVRRINGQICGWFGKAIIWKVRRPSMINARLQLGFRTASQNDRIILLDGHKRLLKSIVMPAAPAGASRTISFKYDPVVQAISVAIHDEKQSVVRVTVRVRRSQSLFVGFGAAVRYPGDKMDVSIRVVSTKAKQ